MEHRTDEEREDLGAGPFEGAAAEEERESSDEGEGTTATAVADEEAVAEEEAVVENEDGTEEEEDTEEDDDAEDEATVSEEGDVVMAVDAGTTNGTAPSSNGTDHVELYSDSDMEEFRLRWATLLTGFVDDPRASAEQADGLIGELVDRVSQRRQELHDALDRDDDLCEAEAMRQAIKRYRAIYRALVRE